MKEKSTPLIIYYHCHPGCPQLVTYCDIVDTEEEYNYPTKELPVIVSLNQELPYLDADLLEKTTTKTIRYIVGIVEPADRILTFETEEKVDEFLAEYPEGKVISYTSPNGKVYTTPKTDCTKAFATREELKQGVDEFVSRFLNIKAKENTSKVYVKKSDTKE